MHVGVKGGPLKNTAGHLGQKALSHLMNPKFFWPGMSRDIKRYVNACIPCQKASSIMLNKMPQTLNPVPVPFGKQWSQLGIDLMTLPVTDAGYRYILCVVDYFTKWVELAPLKSKAAAEVAVQIWGLMNRHGAAHVHITDQGREFCNDVASYLYSATGTKHRVTSAYHPQANGLVERMNRHVTKLICCAIQEEDHEQQDWVYLLPSIQSSINRSVCETTGFSPFEMMHGRKITLFEEVGENLPDDPSEQDPSFTREESLQLEEMTSLEAQRRHVAGMSRVLKQIYGEAKPRIKIQQAKQKKYFDLMNNNIVSFFIYYSFFY